MILYEAFKGLMNQILERLLVGGSILLPMIYFQANGRDISREHTEPPNDLKLVKSLAGVFGQGGQTTRTPRAARALGLAQT